MQRNEYLNGIATIIEKIKKNGSEYYELTKRPLGITGEVAEYEAIKLLDLHPCDARQPGHDAIRFIRENETEKIQIKGKVIQKNSNTNSRRIGSIKLNNDWDFVFLVLLDYNYNPTHIYEAGKKEIITALTIPGSNARNIGGQLHVNKFIQIGKLIWSNELR
jgi:hypothetical protein